MQLLVGGICFLVIQILLKNVYPWGLPFAKLPLHHLSHIRSYNYLAQQLTPLRGISSAFCRLPPFNHIWRLVLWSPHYIDLLKVAGKNQHMKLQSGTKVELSFQTASVTVNCYFLIHLSINSQTYDYRQIIMAKKRYLVNHLLEECISPFTLEVLRHTIMPQEFMVE